jgi:hypothetical protein
MQLQWNDDGDGVDTDAPFIRPHVRRRPPEYLPLFYPPIPPILPYFPSYLKILFPRVTLSEAGVRLRSWSTSEKLEYVSEAGVRVTFQKLEFG